MKEVAPGVAVVEVIARTEAALIVPAHVSVMPIVQDSEARQLRMAV